MKRSQQAIGLLLLLTAWGLIACSALPPATAAPSPTPTARPAPEPVVIQLDEPFTVSVDQPAELAEQGFLLTFHDVLEESRCPSKVQCAEAGQARISIRVSQNGEAEETLEMNTNPPLKQDVVVYGDFQIQLMTLNPYPEEIEQRIPAKQYEATFVVTEVTP